MQIDGVWKHHLRSERARQSLATDAGAWNPFGQPQPDVLDEMAQEEERRSVFGLVAAAEAAILIECDRIAKQERSTRAVALENLINTANEQFHKGKRRGPHPDLGSVLHALFEHGDPHQKRAIAGFRPLVDHRHWLAHGRQWLAPPLVNAPAAWASIQVLFDALAFPMPPQPTRWV